MTKIEALLRRILGNFFKPKIRLTNRHLWANFFFKILLFNFESRPIGEKSPNQVTLIMI
jgi:hypothetical protein